jgi:hypothetical protein
MEVSKINGYGIEGGIPLTHQQMGLHHKELPWVLLGTTAPLGLDVSQPTQNCGDGRSQVVWGMVQHVLDSVNYMGMSVVQRGDTTCEHDGTDIRVLEGQH